MLPVNMKQLTRPSDIAVQTWIDPIRKIYESSQRPEIVEHRERYRREPLSELPGLHDRAYLYFPALLFVLFLVRPSGGISLRS